MIRGGSCIVDPLDGAYLDLDVVGHYTRPELFGSVTTG